MNIIKVNLLDYIKDKQQIIIPHVTNTEKVMGAGFAWHLKNAYPDVERVYVTKKQTLGTVTTAVIAPHVYVCNMTAQTLDDEPRRLRYDYLVECMIKVLKLSKDINVKNIVCPAFGSGLAGGNLDFIKELIYDCWERNGLNVTICVI